MSRSWHGSVSHSPPSTRVPSSHSFYGPPSEPRANLYCRQRDSSPPLELFQASPPQQTHPPTPSSPTAPTALTSSLYHKRNLIATTQVAAAAAEELYHAQRRAFFLLSSPPTEATETLAQRRGWADAHGAAAAKAEFNPTLSGQAVQSYREYATQARMTATALREWAEKTAKALDGVAVRAEGVARCEIDSWAAAAQAESKGE